MIVAAGTKVASLRNADVRSNQDVAEIVDPNILADPAMVADRKSPRILNPHVRLDHDAGAHASAKHAEQSALGPDDWKPTRFKNQQADKVPDETTKRAAAWIIFLVGERRQVDPSIGASS